ncbi:MAG: cytochrome P450 [Gemmatimonadetes bacterium]|nr:cytochrome P450 [Gemmatimonadota bacterium]MXX35664.1 cytochrome P450 [Gemmatimonadota bacterium]MYD13504.1 cytochrome P450 [Gemmatimonadota bacterium]MYE70725.1 cytochrome P450 [Gemmatimonadota bacterium]MYI64787.1 cytochrome P450 [Gemmatimonadota bacterium]
MNDTAENSKAECLSLTDELILMLLDEKGGYFHQVPGWRLNCAVVGGVLAELSFRSRLDSDLTSLFVVDRAETGDPVLDPILKEIADEPDQHNARYWIERLAPRAEAIVDQTLDRLVERGILQHHEGEFWTLASPVMHGQRYGMLEEGATDQFVKARIANVIFTDEIPEPRDVVIVCLVNTCDVFRLIFELDEAAEERIKLVCQLDLIGRSIADAVSESLVSPTRRHTAFVKKIPTVSLPGLLRNPHVRDGNLNALFANLAEEYGPVFRIRLPFSERMTFLAGLETNEWVQKRGRRYLRTRDYFSDFEKVYGAVGVLPALDGADHFRLRKFLSPAYSRTRLGGQLDQLYDRGRAYMSTLRVGDSYRATSMSRAMVNAQLSPLFIGVDTQDLMDDLMVYKERALSVHIAKTLPKFTLHTPGMRRRAAVLDTLMERILRVHTPAQRADSPRNLVDDYLSLHASDPQFLPESNLLFAFSAALIASVYLGDTFSLLVYAMASQPDLYDRIRVEADALFANGDPENDDFTPANIDVTHRFLMECLRMYPIVPMSVRNVMNTCTVGNYELPVGERIHIAMTATHYMSEVFSEPYKFDIDRFLPSRREHHSMGFAPYGLGTHRCLGTRWMEMHLAVNLLMLAHYFTIEVSPVKYARKLRFNPFPSLKPSKKLKFRISEQRRELPA